MDPLCFQNMDTFSNILYVKDEKTELSYLAERAVSVDKYKSETCCIVGNYYSLKGNHPKAVAYFERALRLNPDYLAAWTLMGHELVEMREVSKAINAYRRAVDIDPRDYRAWYGLGQAYEIQQMYSYSLHYFRKAVELRPSDSRMWCAVGETYEKMRKNSDAIQCLERAKSLDDPEGIAVTKLARLYQEVKDPEKAEQCYRELLELEPIGEQKADALLFLAKRASERNRLADAEGYCHSLMEHGGTYKQQAKSLLSEVQELRRLS